MSRVHIDGDFLTGKGCVHHCSPTCHPAQTGPEWKYGCLHKAWPQNRAGDFCPIVDCGGDITKCDMRGKKFVVHYQRGLSVRKINAERKVRELTASMAELAVLT